ncbi:hypothetical protein CXF68_15305 [Tenacibaculum sp. Bg11-29]|uniref:fibronectin type III domain-containing protein n=1 Tax=Tenacibaculum sp. Bg11-29 TaxID=2058306 RepID=UPI000C3277D3|nr:fibronectin type III domain-containing protein [Tenacibaculum sp. Bg11-29]PKH51970.1 hypothetical protein CXF68_15305 [Tenacibaculum sp. Bg11-29]
MKTSPNYKNIQQRLLLIVSIFLNTLLFAQTYPVQINPQLIPPYSLKISDYATTTSEKLYLNILLTDINEVGRRVRLKMYIEGQGFAISTQEVIMGETPIFLNGGINTRLSNVDLQAYFQLNNLIGITPQQFNNPLPNGGYDFCFEVYDYFTNRKLSGKSCTTAYLLQNDPPILNLPFKNNIVTATNPQNILFTWTPRHTNANNVQYEYTLKELWDVQNPQASFLASIPFYQTTTYSTTLLVGPEAPQLMSGKIYGWQVRAFVSDGINETSVFKNDGKSEIFWFKYLKDCSAPSFVISQALTAESVQINWQASAHIRYRIQYRKKGFGDDDWFDVNTYTNEGKIFNLEANTVYEFRVGGECTQLSGFAYSNIQEFTTPTTDEAAYYNCGLTPEINITNNDPLPKLGINETFTAGDFPVITRKVTGSNGTFSGWGYITLPFLENIKEIIDAVNILTDDGTEEKKGNINIGKYTRIKVTFSGISINTSYELTKGLVKTDYDPEWGGILDLDAVIDDVFGDDGETNSFDASNIDIKTVTVNADGAIVITAENGETQTITSDKPVTITDKNGDQWTVKEDGTVTKGKVAEGGVPTKNNTEGISSAGNVTEISSKDVRVKFIPSGYYSNDTHNESITSSKYKKQYEFIKTHDDKEYSVLYKLVSDVSSNKTDVVKAEVSFANGKTKKDIVFKTKQGIKIDSSWSGNVVTLKLKREFEFAKDEIIATVKPKDSTKKHTVAGKLNIWHAQQQSINLTLVSVNKANTDGVKKRINEIYNKAGVNFNITTDELKLGLKNLDVGDSDMISNYTQGQKNIISAYKNKAKKEQYYIFFLDKDVELSKKNVEGFMPLKRQFGFVFTQKDPGRVAAHEIGHGIFGLKHPWDQYNTKKGESTYLMDSGTNGTDFTHMDWQKLHAPGIQLYIFQGDEAGELSGRTFLTAEWKPFTFKNESSLVSPSGLENIPNGAIRGIKYKNVVYKSKGNSFTSDSGKKLDGISYKNLLKDDYVYLFKYIKPCDNELYKTKWSNAIGLKGEKNIDYTSDIFEAKVAVKCKVPEKNNECDKFTVLKDENKEHQSRLNFYQKKIDEALEKALSGINSSKGTEERNKGNFNHIQFANVKNSSILQESKNFDILEDKLHLLTHYTKDTYMIVTLLTIDNNTSISNAKLSEMAQISLKHKESLVNGKKVINVIVSSADYESIFGVGLFNKDACYSIGYHQNDSSLIQPSQIKTGNTPFMDIISFYTNIEKPLNLYATVVKSSGSFSSLEKRSRTNVRGFPLINSLATLKSPHLRDIKILRKERPEKLEEDASITERLKYENDFVKWKKKYDDLLEKAEREDTEAIKANNKDYFAQVTGAIELREVYITNSSFKSGLQMRYGAFHFHKEETFDFVVKIAYTFGEYDNLDSKKHFYEGEINRNEVIYGMIDAGSLIFAPIGGDTLFDVAGLLFAAYNQDAGRMGEYSVGLVLVGYAQYGKVAYKNFKLIKSNIKGSNKIKYSLKKINDALGEGEKFVTNVIGRNIFDTRNSMRADNFVFGAIKGLGDIIASNHMIVLGGDLAKTKARLAAIETKTKDGFIDIVIHGADNKLIIDGKEISDYTEITKYLDKVHPSNKKVRLLSCTNLEGARDFTKALGDDYIVHATDGYVRVHNDGLITTVPREIGGDTKWYQLTEGKDEVLTINGPRGPDGVSDAKYLDDFIELSARSADEINWAKLQELNPKLASKVESEFSDSNDRAKFVEDLLHRTTIKKPKTLQKELLFKNLDNITEAHMDAWIILRKANPDIVKNFSNLEGFSNILNRFNKLETEKQKEFLKVLGVTDANKIQSVAQKELLGSSISKLKEEHIDAWLKLREYPEVNAQYKFDDIASLSRKEASLESIVLKYGERGGSLESFLLKFNYKNAAYAAKWAGKVSAYNLNALKKLTGTQYEFMKKAYTFEVIVDGEKIIYSVKGNDWKAFFKELEDSGHFNGFQSHHVFVVETLKASEGYRKWYDKIGHTVMDINGKHHDGLLNLIMLEGYTKPTGIIAARGVHANHKKYNRALIEFFNKRWKKHLEDVGGDIGDAIDLFDDEVLKVQEGMQKLLLEKSVIGYKDASGKWIRTKVDDLITVEKLELML